MEESYRYHIGNLQNILHKRLYIEWPTLSLSEKLSIVSEYRTNIIVNIREIVTKYFIHFEEYSLTTWKETIMSLQLAMYIRAYSIETLREDFIYLHHTVREEKNIDNTKNRMRVFYEEFYSLTSSIQKQSQDICLPVVEQTAEGMRREA
jgi:hypothetical protein